jgi:hypothetical protein
MNKKGVELSMNVIIIAAIGLLVLVILAVLVINSVNKTNTGMQSCNVMGGVCEVSCVGKGEQITNAACTNNARPYCCKIIGIQ